MITKDQYEKLKNNYRDMMKTELESTDVRWLYYGSYAEKIIHEYITMNGLLWDRNDIKNKYTADYVSNNFHYLIDAKNCFNVSEDIVKTLPNNIRYNGNVLKLRLSCINSYYKQCKDKSDIFDWKWALAIYDYNLDEIKFLTQDYYESLLKAGSIHIKKSESCITNKIEDHIFFNTNNCLTLSEFKKTLSRRFKKLSSNTQIFNKSTRGVFYTTLKQYDNNIQTIKINNNYYKFFSPKFNINFIGTTCEKQNDTINLLFEDLSKEDCMILYSSKLNQLKELQEKEGFPIALGFNIKFKLTEKEVKFILLDDFLALLNLKVKSPIYKRPVKGEWGYNFSKEILINEKEFFDEVELRL